MEGSSWVTPVVSELPVFRLYNPNAGDHHYTTSEYERDSLTAAGWMYENIAWYSAASDGAIPVFRLYNPNATGAGSHHYTVNANERDSLAALGWIDEGVGFYCCGVSSDIYVFLEYDDEYDITSSCPGCTIASVRQKQVTSTQVMMGR